MLVVLPLLMPRLYNLKEINRKDVRVGDTVMWQCFQKNALCGMEEKASNKLQKAQSSGRKVIDEVQLMTFLEKKGWGMGNGEWEIGNGLQ